MEYIFQFFISAFVLIVVFVLLQSIFIRYLRRLLAAIAVTCKEHFKPGQKEVKIEENKVGGIDDVMEDSGDELEQLGKLEEILISENEVDFELHRPACRFYYSKYVHHGHEEMETGDKEEIAAKDLLEDSESEIAELEEEATSENEADCECRPNGRFYYMTLIQTPPKSFTDSL